LTEPLEWNATLINGDVPGAIAKLKVEGKNIEMYGSADLMQTLIEHDLIDEYRIWVHPIVIGGGERRFNRGGRTDQTRVVRSTTLRLAGTKPLSSGVVVLAYTPAR